MMLALRHAGGARALNRARCSGLALLAILALAPPARADFWAAGRDTLAIPSLAVPSLAIPALSAFT